jgi:HAD superfamily phosphoserine phosphatase-like hydrolase
MSIFLDFDGTITVQDTIGELAKFALGVRAEQGDDLKQEWDGVVKAYVDDYGRYVDEYQVKESDRCLPEHEVAFLREMKDVELDSLQRINGCRVFRGLSQETLRQAGRDAVKSGTVKIRPGFKQFIEARTTSGWRVWVISVNWSSAFIEGVLDSPDITVVSNHVQHDGSVTGPEVFKNGSEPRNLTNSGDKLAAMNAILGEESLGSNPSFYFGDSITDLECLLAASYGVVMSDLEDSKLLETLRRIGNDVQHIKTRSRSETEQRLSWASTYEEVTDNIVFQL